MKDYKKIFLREDAPVNMTPPPEGDQPPVGNDADEWQASNQPIVNNPELAGKFDVEGLPADISQQYAEKIEHWRKNVANVSDKLEEIYKFAADNVDKPGASEIFSSIGRTVENIMTDLGTLEGQLRSLSNKVKVAVQKDNEKAKGK